MKPSKSPFLLACMRKSSTYTPVWYMRQAGRSLPEYRKLRERYDMLTICRTPELAAEVTLLPVKILRVDAAILFADIMLLPIALGVDIEIVDSVGPVIHVPLRTVDQMKALQPFQPQKIEYIVQAIKLIKKELNIPLIGFSAAPFTLAAYLIEGGASKHYSLTKSYMYQSRDTWDTLMTKLSNAIVVYLKTQVDVGVDALQLFDSWVGVLSRVDYTQYVLPYMKRIFHELGKTHVPLIHFGTNTTAFLSDFASVACDVVGVDWRLSIGTAWDRIGNKKAIQGNMDPAILLTDFSTIKRYATAILKQTQGRQGHIFNLGHGVLPQTPVEHLQRLTEYVHTY